MEPVHPSTTQEPPPTSGSRDLHLFELLRSNAPYDCPSGHVLRATFLAVLVAEYWPRWRAIPILFVGIMAATRIYGGEQWASDVAGGVLGAIVIALAAPKLSELITTNVGRLRAVDRAA